MLFCFFVIFLKNVNVIVNKQLQCHIMTPSRSKDKYISLCEILILLHYEYLKFDSSNNIQIKLRIAEEDTRSTNNLERNDPSRNNGDIGQTIPDQSCSQMMLDKTGKCSKQRLATI